MLGDRLAFFNSLRTVRLLALYSSRDFTVRVYAPNRGARSTVRTHICLIKK